MSPDHANAILIRFAPLEPGSEEGQLMVQHTMPGGWKQVALVLADAQKAAVEQAIAEEVGKVQVAQQQRIYLPSWPEG